MAFSTTLGASWRATLKTTSTTAAIGETFLYYYHSIDRAGIHISVLCIYGCVGMSFTMKSILHINGWACGGPAMLVVLVCHGPERGRGGYVTLREFNVKNDAVVE